MDGEDGGDGGGWLDLFGCECGAGHGGMVVLCIHPLFTCWFRLIVVFAVVHCGGGGGGGGGVEGSGGLRG